MCADAIFNRDWLFQAKAVDIRKSYGTSYDPSYCHHNGWLSPELRALQHDFDGLKLKADEFCSSQDVKQCHIDIDCLKIVSLSFSFGFTDSLPRFFCKRLTKTVQDQQKILSMTMKDANETYWLGYYRGRPSPEEARETALWTCAMGTAACDMAYCTYSFYELNRSFGIYNDCNGWDPIKGMPI